MLMRPTVVLAARGAVAGAALFGALVAALGGATPQLLLVFLGLGMLGVLFKDSTFAWARRRNLIQ